MSKPFKLRMLVWVWDGLNAFLSGLAGGLLTALSGLGVDSITGGTASAFTPRQIAIVCAVAGMLSWANYVRQRRLPTIEDTDTNTPSAGEGTE